MRGEKIVQKGLIPGTTTYETIWIPFSPDELESVTVLYGQRKTLKIERNLTREEIDAAEAEYDKNGEVNGYVIGYMLSVGETFRLMPESEYRVQVKYTTSDGVTGKSEVCIAVTGDTDEWENGVKWNEERNMI